MLPEALRLSKPTTIQIFLLTSNSNSLLKMPRRSAARKAADTEGLKIAQEIAHEAEETLG